MSRRWLPILVAIDAVLVLAVLITVLIVVRPAGPASQAPPGTATTTQGATPKPSPTLTPGPPTFRLPSGNIGCAMTADQVTCTIADKTFKTPPRDGCEADDGGHTVVLTADGVAVPCTEAARPGPDVPTLNYGSASTVGPYTCTSATDGVVCVDTSGRGFRLARASLTMLP